MGTWLLNKILAAVCGSNTRIVYNDGRAVGVARTPKKIRGGR
jgi:hypothetical protein